MITCAAVGVNVCDKGTVAKGQRLMATAGKVAAANGYPLTAVPAVAMDMVAELTEHTQSSLITTQRLLA